MSDSSEVQSQTMRNTTLQALMGASDAGCPRDTECPRDHVIITPGAHTAKSKNNKHQQTTSILHDNV
jgi:hypothetical protein